MTNSQRTRLFILAAITISVFATANPHRVYAESFHAVLQNVTFGGTINGTCLVGTSQRPLKFGARIYR
jgi:hypothetical protein